MTNNALIVPAPSPTATNAAENIFHETPAPPLVISDPWFWFWLIVILAAVATALFLWLRRRRKDIVLQAPPPIPPHVRARRALEDALVLISEAKAFSIRVSDILRLYLEERFEFRAPERTTEEFLLDLQNTNLLTQEQKDSLAAFLNGCDLVKFARYEPTETELREFHKSALQLVNQTEPPAIAQPAPASKS